jgi:excisionase family DNA binding protein
MTETEIESPVLTPSEAAKYIKTSPRNLWAMTDRREIAAVRYGKRSVRYMKTDLDKFLADRRASQVAS